MRRTELAADPFEQFARWYDLAAAEIPLAEAMTVATVDTEGAPDARMVLLKGHGPDGFRFHTNYESAKAAEIAADPCAALILYWREHDRQVRARGPIERLSPADSDAYFASRDRESRLGAWASPQSRLLEEIRTRFAAVEDIPRPDHWGGYVLRPLSIEFWQAQRARLHDRFLYSRADGAGDWTIQRLAP